jgi:hypothetical protein
MYTVFAHIHPPTPFPHHLSPTPSHWYQTQSWAEPIQALLLSDFVEEKGKRKKMTFLLDCDKCSYTGDLKYMAIILNF